MAWERAFPALIVLASALARLPLLTETLGYDESQHFLVARSPWFADFWREFRERAHPPLGYLVMKAPLLWGDSAMLMRLPAVACGLLAPLLAYRVLRRQDVPARASVFGALAAAWLPAFVEQSVEVRAYSFCLVVVWLGFLVYAHALEHGPPRVRDQWLLAGIQGIAFLLEYSAAFHLAALFLVACVPVALAHAQRGRWKELVLSLLPHLSVFLLALHFFQGHFAGTVPAYGHTRPYVYAGSLGDPVTVLGFFTERLSAFLSGVLPAPWGWALPVLILAAFLPAPERAPLARTGRTLGAYALVALGLLAAASLVGKYPFGGAPRHSVVVVPGLLLAACAGTARVLERAGRVRAGVALLLLLALLPGVLWGWTVVREKRPRVRMEGWRELKRAYAQSPGPLVSNWRGRNLLSWHFLRERPPRLVLHRGDEKLFDYGGIPVVEARRPEGTIEAVSRLARARGQCWVFLAFLDAREGERAREALEREWARAPGVSLAFLFGGTAVDVPVVVARVIPR